MPAGEWQRRKGHGHTGRILLCAASEGEIEFVSFYMDEHMYLITSTKFLVLVQLKECISINISGENFILEPRFQRGGSYKFCAVIVNGSK